VIEHDFQTTVARSSEEVFDFLVDLRNAPQWEPNCQEVEKTSDGPIGKDTTFRAKKGMGRLGLVLPMRPRIKRMLGELPDHLRRVIEAQA
jgi:hypothetical protein